MASDIKLKAGTRITNLFNSGVNLRGLANGSGILETAGGLDNTSVLAVAGLFELQVTFASNPTLNALVNLYAIPSNDGTNYASTVDGATPFVPSDCYIGGFQVQAATTAKLYPLYWPPNKIAPVKYFFYCINNAGYALPASNVTMSLVPYYYQST